MTNSVITFPLFRKPFEKLERFGTEIAYRDMLEARKKSSLEYEILPYQWESWAIH